MQVWIASICTIRYNLQVAVRRSDAVIESEIVRFPQLVHERLDVSVAELFCLDQTRKLSYVWDRGVLGFELLVDLTDRIALFVQGLAVRNRLQFEDVKEQQLLVGFDATVKVHFVHRS